jgi:glutamate--cysteine ligase
MILGGGDDAYLQRPLADLSKADLARLFLDAAKPDTQWYVGLELELFPFWQDSLRPVEHAALAEVLERLGKLAGMTGTHEPDGALTGLKGNGELISLEPGGQLEFASRPHRSLQALRTEILDYAAHLVEAGRSAGIGYWAAGLQPLADRHAVPVMPKPRYAQMRRYLGARGRRSLDMMHLTGSVQSTVDFQSEQNLVDKVRTAARVSPFLSALVSASPFSGGRINGFKTVRYQTWLEVDDERCGIWPEMVDAEGLTPARYIERTLRTPPMFFIRDGQYVAGGPEPYAHYMQHGFEGRTVTVADYLDHLTSFFPEIRPKGYVELRGADCVRPEEAVAVAGFWRGILDHEPTRQAVDERLAVMDWAALRALQPEVARHGLDADSPAGPVREVIRWVVQAGYERLAKNSPDCAECVVPLVERAELGRSPADEMLAIAERDGIAAALELVKL